MTEEVPDQAAENQKKRPAVHHQKVVHQKAVLIQKLLHQAPIQNRREEENNKYLRFLIDHRCFYSMVNFSFPVNFKLLFGILSIFIFRPKTSPCNSNPLISTSEQALK